MQLTNDSIEIGRSLITVKMATNHEGKKTFQGVLLVRQLQTVNKKFYLEKFIRSIDDTSQKFTIITEAWEHVVCSE